MSHLYWFGGKRGGDLYWYGGGELEFVKNNIGPDSRYSHNKVRTLKKLHVIFKHKFKYSTNKKFMSTVLDTRLSSLIFIWTLVFVEVNLFGERERERERDRERGRW